MIGQTISHFRILAKLGEGRTGVVYKAEDLDLHVPRALRLLPSYAGASLEDEIRAAAGLEHPAICPVHEIGRVEGHTFIVTSFLEGRTLADHLAAGGPLPIAQALDVAAELAGALSRAHAAGIVHGDLKPANVMLTGGRRPVLMDLGLARMAASTRLTGDAATLATAAYMAPEQVRGEPVDGRTDIWALGASLYEMLAGRAPFGGDFSQAAMYAILHEQPTPLAELAPATPAALGQLVERCLARDPARRFATVDELQAALNILRDEVVSGSRCTRSTRLRRSRRRRRLLLAVAALAMVTAVAMGWRVATQRARIIDAIAVLPFFNLSGDPSQQYYADGMTDQLIAGLQQLVAGTDLRVIGRTSVMHYRDTDLSLPQIAEELGVDAVVEASVLRGEHTVRISAKLIRARPERQIWAETFDCRPAEVLVLQAKLAEIVADLVAADLSPETTAQVHAAAQRPLVLEAYEVYLQGRHDVGLNTAAGVRQAIASYDRAIELDPDFAPAHAGRAEALGLLNQLESILPGDQAAIDTLTWLESTRTQPAGSR